MIRYVYIIVLFTGSLWINTPSWAQSGQISGKVVTEQLESLSGANIYLSGTAFGTTSGKNGEFIFRGIPPGEYTIVISMIGYSTYKESIRVSDNETTDLGRVQLTTAPLSGDMVVVTASKYQQDVKTVPASINLVTREDILKRNNLTVDEALTYIPGINLNASQVNIRGSSGYSRGVGSRVLFLLDGIPLLTGDTREMNFDVLPAYLVDRIEIVKGAGSALYGSSALGGVINILTPDPLNSPRISVKFYGGLFTDTAYDQWNWWDGTRFSKGADFMLNRMFGKTGVQLGGSFDGDDGYRQNSIRSRYTGSCKIGISLSENQRLILSGNYMYQERENFLYWRNLFRALQPPADQIGDEVISRRHYLTANYRQILGSKTYFTFRGIWFRNRFEDNIAESGGNRALSDNLTGELQFNTQFGLLLFTAGIEGLRNSIDSDIFGKHGGMGSAGYLQAESQISRQWHISAGVRLDYFDIDSVEADYQINPKLGIVFQPVAGTSVRAAFGMGFRAPSMAEIFTSTDASGFRVIPNLNLKPERSRYLEIGWKQFVGKSHLIDLSLFYSRFSDLIEGDFLESGEIQFRNITRARIRGTEVTLYSRPVPDYLNLQLSHTYVDPMNLDNGDFLKFRPRHIFQGGVEIDLQFLQTGLDYRYIKKYDRIDEKFSLLIEDVEARVDAHIVDFRVSRKFKLGQPTATLSLVVNNLFQYYYVDLVGSLAPLRQIVLTLDLSL